MRKGDFEIIYNQYYKVLFYYALRFVTETKVAEDIIHDVFCDFWIQRKTINLNQSFKSYLYTSVRNRSLDYIKSSYHKSKDFNSTDQYLEQYVYSALTTTEEYIFSKELVEVLSIAIDNLPYRCKEVFLLSRSSDLKNREIAEKLNIHLKTVEKHITKALLEIKAHLEKNGYLMLLISYLILLK